MCTYSKRYSFVIPFFTLCKLHRRPLLGHRYLSEPPFTSFLQDNVFDSTGGVSAWVAAPFPNVPPVLWVTVSVIVLVSLLASADTGAVFPLKARTNIASLVDFLVVIIEQGLNAFLIAKLSSIRRRLRFWVNWGMWMVSFEWTWRLCHG